MNRIFKGSITFQHPETKEDFEVHYSGTYRSAKTSGSADTARDKEVSITFKNLPSELEDYEDVIREEVIFLEDL